MGTSATASPAREGTAAGTVSTGTPASSTFRSQGYRIRLPRFLLREDVGLGTAVRRLTTKIGIRACDACQQRAMALDSRVVLTARAAGPVPKPGCWFAGTSCYGFVQTLKFCCGDGTEYTERWGWCVGIWFAPPCLPDRDPNDVTRRGRPGGALPARRATHLAGGIVSGLSPDGERGRRVLTVLRLLHPQRRSETPANQSFPWSGSEYDTVV